MKIQSIEIENIRSYKKQFIKFENGINFLSGDIGSGKSSILQALEFAFLGFKRGDLEGIHLLRKGENEGSVKVILENNLNNETETIEIFRRLKKSKNGQISQDTGFLKIKENLLELTPAELNAQLFNLLNLPKEFIKKDKNLIYRFTIYTPQEQLKEVLFSSPEKRLEIIRKIFSIDKYKQLKNAIAIYLEKIREDKRFLEGKLESRIYNNSDLKNLEIDIQNLDLSKKELETDLEFKKIEFTNLKKEIANLEDKIEFNFEKEKIFEKNLAKINLVKKQIKEKQIEINNKLKNSKEIIFEDLTSKINLINKALKENLFKLNLNKNEENLIKEKIKDFINLKEKKEKINLEIKKRDKLKTSLEIKNNNLKSKQNKIKIKEINIEIEELNNNKLKITSDKKELNEDRELSSKNITEIILENKFSLKENISKICELKNSKEKVSSLSNCQTCGQEVNENYKKEFNEKINYEILDFEKKNKVFEEDISKFEVNLNKILCFEEKEKSIENQILQKKQTLKYLEEEILLEKKTELEIQNETNEINNFFTKNLDEKLQILDRKTEEFEIEKKKLQEIITIKHELKTMIFKNETEIKDLNSEIEKKKNLDNEIANLQIKNEKLKPIAIRKIEFEEKLKMNKKKKEILKIDLTKNKQALEELNGKNNKISNLIASNNTLLIEKLNLLKKITLEIANQNKNKEILKSLLYRETFLSKKVVNISTNIETNIFTKYYIEFNEEFEKLFRVLIEDNQIETRLDSEFSPIVEQNGYDIDILNLSGGEKSSLALSYRLALKKMIENNISGQKLSFLILDEPTDGFSSQQIDRLGEILKGLNLKQIILVSHDARIEAIANNILNVEKINHVSKVS